MRPSKPGFRFKARTKGREEDDDLQFVRRRVAEQEDLASRMVAALRAELTVKFVDVERQMQRHAKRAGEAMLAAAASKILQVKAEADARAAEQDATVSKQAQTIQQLTQAVAKTAAEIAVVKSRAR